MDFHVRNQELKTELKQQDGSAIQLKEHIDYGTVIMLYVGKQAERPT